MKRKFKYYSKNKKLSFSLSLILFVSLMIILFSIFMQIRIFEIKREQNQAVYGAWNAAVYDISETSESKIVSNQMIRSIGNMNIVGEVMEDTEYKGSIGYVDKDFLEMSNISMKAGHMPENKNEIAIEAYVLDLLGIDYELDQKVNLDIHMDDSVIHREYVLSGVINNYSSSWTTDGTLASFFIFPSEDAIISKNLFLIAKEGYIDSINEIQIDDDIVMNAYVEFTYDPFSDQNIPFTLLGIFTVCYSILLIAYVFIHWANQHTKEIQILKSLGTDNKMLVKDFISLLFKSICLPLCVYLIICIVLSINIWVSLISLMVYLFSLSMIVLICYIYISSVSINVNSFSSQKTIIKKTIKVRYKKQTPFSLFVRSFRFHHKRELLRISISVVLLTLLYHSLTLQIHEQYQLNEIYTQPDIQIAGKNVTSFKCEVVDDNGDRVIGYRTKQQDISDQLDVLLSNQSIENYYSSNLNYDVAVTWPEIEQSFLWNKKGMENHLMHFMNYDWQNQKCLFPNIYSTKQTEYLKFLKDNIDDGEFNEEAFLKGKEIYIYLPEYTTENLFDTQNTAYVSTDPNTFYDLNKVVQEDTIKIGTKLTLRTADGFQKEAKVGGIIRHVFEEYDPSLNNETPYTVFVSPTFFDSKGQVNQLYLYLDKNIQQEPTEAFYASICAKNDLSFFNNAQNKRIQQETIQNNMVLNSVILTIVIAIVLFTQYILFRQKNADVKDKIKIYHQLGIDKSILHKIKLYEILIESLIIISISFGLFVFIQNFDYLQAPSLMYPFSNRFSQEYWSWPLYFLVTLAFLTLYVLSILKTGDE